MGTPGGEASGNKRDWSWDRRVGRGWTAKVRWGKALLNLGATFLFDGDIKFDMIEAQSPEALECVQDAEYSLLCYSVGPSGLSILCTVVGQDIEQSSWWYIVGPVEQDTGCSEMLKRSSKFYHEQKCYKLPEWPQTTHLTSQNLAS